MAWLAQWLRDWFSVLRAAGSIHARNNFLYGLGLVVPSLGVWMTVGGVKG